MTAVDKQVCERLMAKGKWSEVMCELCCMNSLTCEVRQEYDARVYEENCLKHREEREVVAE